MVGKPFDNDPALSRLVERQVRNWELGRSQRFESFEPEPPEVEDFLCLSRMVGVDERDVAAKLGERLGWPVFDREILEAMAGDDDLRRRIYTSMDERDLSWWEQTLRSLFPTEFVRNDYFRRLCETVLSLARQGCCVFVGRGADLVLPRERGFRVRLVAPLATRIQRYAVAHGIGAQRAAREIERLERERADFFHHHFRVDANDPFRHDVSLNLERMRPEQAVEVTLATRRIFLDRAAAKPRATTVTVA